MRNPRAVLPSLLSLSLVLGAGLLVSSSLTHALDTLRVDNFLLLDHQGAAQELHYSGPAKAVAIMVQQNGCKAAEPALAAYTKLSQGYADKPVRFLLLNSSRNITRADLQAEAAAKGIELPIMRDSNQLIGESLEVTRAGELLVLNTRDYSLAYRGSLDQTANKTLEGLLLADEVSNEFINNPMPTASGCDILFTQRNADHSNISYSDTVAPLLKEKCAVCHRPEGIGPWAMTNYNMVRGFAPMIREVIRTKRMPPWHADPHVGTWVGDRSLSPEQAQTLVHWIEAGAPRGIGPDPLTSVVAQGSDWTMGEPDFIVELPPFTVPATGTVEYQFPVVKNTLGRDVWVRAATVVPGDRSVVHHVLVGAADGPAEERKNTESVFDNYIIGYAPGNESSEMPKGTGVFIPAGGDFLFQLHYTPTGKKTVDSTKLGLYFAEKPPANFYRHNVVLSPAIDIPPNAPAHEEVAYFAFHADAYLHSMVPHAHYRGRQSSFELVYPDGETEMLLSVPRYDFNWQRTYEFTQAKMIPAGSRIVHRTTYDNSKHNPGNPDPDRRVPWGLQSWDEMLYGAFSYSWADESSANPTHDKRRGQITQMIGFMDKNMDGRLAWSELSKGMKKRLVQGFKMADQNADGGLSVDEFLAMEQMRAKRSANAR